jgi:hypothetical protein
MYARKRPLPLCVLCGVSIALIGVPLYPHHKFISGNLIEQSLSPLIELSSFPSVRDIICISAPHHIVIFSHLIAVYLSPHPGVISVPSLSYTVSLVVLCALLMELSLSI